MPVACGTGPLWLLEPPMPTAPFWPPWPVAPWPDEPVADGCPGLPWPP